LALEELHLALPSSGRLVRILGAIVLPATAFMMSLDSEMVGGGAIRIAAALEPPAGN
jgi:hypothetical protein